jgi:predicted ArsR family transcriptional regulator
MPRANGITRQEILTCLKYQGSMTAEELARELGISQVAVRQHLTSLEAEESIAIQVERKGLGRPSHRYHLTSKGDETFPRIYGTFANGLLDELRAWQGEEAVVELLERQRERCRLDWNPRLREKSVGEKVNELARLLSENGFMAEASPGNEDDYILIKRNCALCAVARNHPNVCCQTSAEFYKRLLGNVEVERGNSILNGEQRCEFFIRQAEESTT